MNVIINNSTLNTPELIILPYLAPDRNACDKRKYFLITE